MTHIYTLCSSSNEILVSSLITLFLVQSVLIIVPLLLLFLYQIFALVSPPLEIWLLSGMILSYRRRKGMYIYRNLSKIRPWAMNLSDSSKKGVGVFSRVVIFLSKIRPPHTQLVQPLLLAHVVMQMVSALIC